MERRDDLGYRVKSLARNLTRQAPRGTGPLRICLVTEELPGVGGSGGIGAAFNELALALSLGGAVVDLVHLPNSQPELSAVNEATARFAALGIKYTLLSLEEHVASSPTPQARAWAVFSHLADLDVPYDVIHFHDYKGLGFYALSARAQGARFQQTHMVVQLHGPSRWTLEANDEFWRHPDQIRIDHLERACIRMADHVVSPSSYMLRWLETNGYELPERRHVIKNAFAGLLRTAARFASVRPKLDGRLREIIFFGRHEARKGLAVFLDALQLAGPALAEGRVEVTFLGGLGQLAGLPSELVLAERAKGWQFPARLLPSFGRDQAAAYLASREGALVVVPSAVENSPYTVLEAAALGLPVLTSSEGGAPELLAPESRQLLTCRMEKRALAARLEALLRQGLPAPGLAESADEVERAWRGFHEELGSARPRAVRRGEERPRVVVGITHHERPDKLVEAILSFAAQTYDNLEIVVVDDGSSSPETLEALREVEVLLQRVGGRLIRRENGYLGAARNTVLRETQSEYVLFFDDDDLALPGLVESLVLAMRATGADAVSCLNAYMPEAERVQMGARSSLPRPSYFPTGGPLALAPFENVFGSAVALFRREALEKVGGYTELVGVGHEDYELYIRLVASGARLEVCPEVLFLYETGRPSMSSRTSVVANFQRCRRALEEAGLDARSRSDLLSFSMGPHVDWVTSERVRWSLQSSPHAALLVPLMSPGLPVAERLGRAADYAAASGNPVAEGLFRAALVSASPATQAEPGAFPAAYVAAGAARSAQPRTDLPQARVAHAIRVSLALGRTDEAWQALWGARDGVGASPGPELFSVAAAVLDKSEGGQARERAVRLLGLSSWRLVPPSREAASFFVKAGAAASDDAARRTGLALGFLRDEDAYLSSNPDVGLAVLSGEVPSGYSHFMMFGKGENRSGFGTFEETMRLYRRTGGGAVTIEAIMDEAHGLARERGKRVA